MDQKFTIEWKMKVIRFAQFIKFVKEKRWSTVTKTKVVHKMKNSLNFYVSHIECTHVHVVLGVFIVVENSNAPNSTI